MTTNNERVADTSKTIDHIADVSKKVSLTELLKKGELPKGVYYVTYYKNDTPEVDIYRRVYSLYNDSKVRFTIPQVNKVLAPVPSYEEWQKVLNIDFNNEVLRLENAKLKELLKECRDEIKFMYDTYGKSFPKPFDNSLLTKIDQELEKK